MTDAKTFVLEAVAEICQKIGVDNEGLTSQKSVRKLTPRCCQVDGCDLGSRVEISPFDFSVTGPSVRLGHRGAAQSPLHLRRLREAPASPYLLR